MLFAGMDGIDRQIALLHYVDQLPQEEIAQALGVWRRTVGRRLDKIRARAIRLAGGEG